MNDLFEVHAASEMTDKLIIFKVKIYQIYYCEMLCSPPLMVVFHSFGLI